MWIYSTAAVSPRSHDMEKVKSGLRSMTEAVNKTRNVPPVACVVVAILRHSSNFV